MSTKRDSQKQISIVLPQYSLNNDEPPPDPIKCPVKKGKPLESIIEPLLESHGISFDSHSLFLESSNTPLPLSSDSIHYGGNVLFVRDNGSVDVDRRIMHIMKKSEREKRLSVDISKEFWDLLDKEAEEKEEGGGDGGDVCDGDAVLVGGAEDELALETSWKEVITEEEDMLYRIKVQQQAIWELFSTEITFIEDMKVIIDVFEARLHILQNGGFMKEVDEQLIFSNIHQVYESNLAFWRRLKQIVEHARKTRKPICPSDLVKAFDGFEELFHPYIQFCNADTSNVKLPDYSASTTEMIKQYFSWCDNHTKCKRITMAGFLIKPLQRVTKYSLLLKAIVNKTDDVEEKSIAEEIMSRVETFVSKINYAIHLRQEQEKLNNVIMRVAEYSPMESLNEEVDKITKEFCNLNLKRKIPGLAEGEPRFLLKEGPMKIVDKQLGKKEVYAFLFTDIFVITKLKKNSDMFRVTRPPYRLNKVVLRDLKEPGNILVTYLNEYGLLANAFVIQLEIGEHSKWRTALQNAKDEYEKKINEFGRRDEPAPPGSSDDAKLQRKSSKRAQDRDHVCLPPLRIGKVKIEWTTFHISVGVFLFLLTNVFVSNMLR